MDVISEDAADWQRARSLFLRLVELDPDTRQSELDRETGDDPRLRAWVERLLAQDLGPDDAVAAGTNLRLGAYEILHSTDVLHKVAINEAINLSRRFSTEESCAFVNGILDKIRETAPGGASDTEETARDEE